MLDCILHPPYQSLLKQFPNSVNDLFLPSIMLTPESECSPLFLALAPGMDKEAKQIAKVEEQS